MATEQNSDFDFVKQATESKDELMKELEADNKRYRDSVKQIEKEYDHRALIADQVKQLKEIGSSLHMERATPSPLDYRAPVLPPNPNWTSEIFKHVKKWIEDFESKLDPAHEVGARLVNFGQAIQFYLDSIEYCQSPLMLFKGTTEDGLPVELIQHVSQISILLVKLPKQNPEAPRRTIGFHEDGA